MAMVQAKPASQFPDALDQVQLRDPWRQAAQPELGFPLCLPGCEEFGVDVPKKLELRYLGGYARMEL
jgi:hypothetical protein